MELSSWILLAGVLVMVILAYTIHANQNDLEERVNSALRSNLKTTLEVTDPLKKRLDELFRDQSSILEVITKMRVNSDTVGKEFEVMSIRQRTLEKKIIEANRTVNLVFGKPIPMQLENIPHQILKEKRGAGKGALIPEKHQ